MKETLEASSTLSLDDVQRLLKLEEIEGGSFTELLSVESLPIPEQRELLKIRRDFRRYWADGKVSEGLVKFLALAPLMRLTGFYDAPLQISMEDSIPIEVESEEKTIKGTLDILAVTNTEGETAANLWILVIEAKNSAIAPLAGLPQLLTYALKSLEQQSLVWGLATNGVSYEFVILRRGNPPTYQILPELNLIDSDRAIELGQVLKAICKLQPAQLV